MIKLFEDSVDLLKSSYEKIYEIFTFNNFTICTGVILYAEQLMTLFMEINMSSSMIVMVLMFTIPFYL